MRLGGLDSANAGADDSSKPPAFQIIVLGSGGGPNEDNVTGLLVRSTATNWAKGSVLAVDAGTHLAAVIRIFDRHLHEATTLDPSAPSASLANHGGRRRASSTQGSRSLRHSSDATSNGRATPMQPSDAALPLRLLTTGPFADLAVPFESVKANASYFMRDLISTYLITHPHLDHISGFAINTASFQHTSRPKRVAALPSTIDAIKTHIFNDVIWPNMSDEDGGIGFVSYMRLVEGGNIQFGDGESRGYIEVCDGLAVKAWSVSHGQCANKHRGNGGGNSDRHDSYGDSLSRRTSQHATTPTALQHGQNYAHPGDMMRAVDSSAFFLRDDHTGKEVLIFGDVEPDSLSMSPRTLQVWNDAASKIAAGLLIGILIECSYDNSQSDETLFGHLSPRHVIAELRVLADKVKALRPAEQEPSARKRKRQSNGFKMHEDPPPIEPRSSRRGRTPSLSGRKTRRSTISPGTPARRESDDSEMARPTRDLRIDVPASISEAGAGYPPFSSSRPLQGLQVIIIHVKETLKDGPEPGETILAQLEQAEREEGFGCTFQISEAGSSIWL